MNKYNDIPEELRNSAAYQNEQKQSSNAGTPVQATFLKIKCPECGGALVLRQSKHGKFYGCSNYPSCDVLASIDKKTGRMNSPANGQTRKARTQAHEIFDRIWQLDIMTRSEAYKTMYEELHIQHIGESNLDECQQVISWANEILIDAERSGFI